MNTKSDAIAFWESRYQAGKMPWDFHGVPRALTGWLKTANSPGRVLIPGCGSGYEVKAFQDAGWEVTAIDYSPAAVARAKAALGALADKVMLADFFAHDFGGRKFDVIYERTFLCSLPPERWPAYARRMAGLLAECGQLVGFFLYGYEAEPPPYPMTEEAAKALLGENFVRVSDEAVTDSLPVFAGRERWQVWQKTKSKRKQTMKKNLIICSLAIIAATTVRSQNQTNSTPPAELSKTNAVLGIENFMKNVDRYRGEVQVEGVVAVVSATNQMLSLIDTREFQTCGLEKCGLSLPVRWTGTMPAVGQAVRTAGEVQKAKGKLVFVAKTLEKFELPKQGK